MGNLQNYVIVARTRKKVQVICLSGNCNIHEGGSGRLLGSARTGFVDFTGTHEECIRYLEAIGLKRPYQKGGV